MPKLHEGCLCNHFLVPVITLILDANLCIKIWYTNQSPIKVSLRLKQRVNKHYWLGVWSIFLSPIHWSTLFANHKNSFHNNSWTVVLTLCPTRGRIKVIICSFNITSLSINKHSTLERILKTHEYYRLGRVNHAARSTTLGGPLGKGAGFIKLPN